MMSCMYCITYRILSVLFSACFLTQSDLSICRQEALSRNRDNWQSTVTKDLIGACVLTRYNDKLYRVDDINFDITPKNTFPNREGGEV